MIAIIDYKAGNITSIKNALRNLGVDYIITSNPIEILQASGVILPGQGRAGNAMKELKSTKLDKIIPKISKPFLGICIGMQLLLDSSEEDETNCLSIIKGRCYRFPRNLKTPHTGWNKLTLIKKSPLTKDIDNEQYFYFTHSYYSSISQDYIVGETIYGFKFPSIVQKNNFFATQFHPEKSGDVGIQLLNNFCKLCL